MLAGTTNPEQTASCCALTWLECVAAGLFGWKSMGVLMSMHPCCLQILLNRPEHALTVSCKSLRHPSFVFFFLVQTSLSIFI